MFVEKAFNFDISHGQLPYKGKYPEPSECPICKHAIKPEELHLQEYKDEYDNWFITGLYLCRHCYKTFTALYSCKLLKTSSGSRIYNAKLEYCGPSRFEKRQFEDKMNKVSPRFVEVYNQAKAAEEYGLTQICGIGYRKALEFLIKDYLIYKTPDQAETIKGMNLGRCISDMISDEDIKMAASRCVWLGNDQTHYIQRFEEFDLDVLKTLLEATIYWVSMKFATEFAASIEPRR